MKRSGLMTQMGCDLGQGYSLGRPEPASDFIARVTEEARTVSVNSFHVSRQ